MRGRTARTLALVGTVIVGAAACDDAATTLEPETRLLSVAPEGGASNVALDASLEVVFDGPMDGHAADYAAVHEGDVTGPTVPGAWMMEESGTVMRFVPDEGWRAGAGYTLHLGGGMVDADGHAVDFEGHGTAMGGMWADGSMMSGGMMGGGQHPHMGADWQHENGSYGMVFGFTTASDAGSTGAALMAVAPEGGATDVDPTEPVVVTFDHAIDPVMAEYAAVHEGDVTGPEVAGAWSLSEDSTQLIFTQDEPLKAGTEYTIHLGGGMTDADGYPVDMGTNGTHMGGEWATASMMGAGMHGGMSGGQHDHMGSGWKHPDNGSYGMIFAFTTAE